MTKAVMLAASKLVIGGKRLLEHVLDRPREASIEAVFIATRYRAKKIEQHFAG